MTTQSKETTMLTFDEIATEAVKIALAINPDRMSSTTAGPRSVSMVAEYGYVVPANGGRPELKWKVCEFMVNDGARFGGIGDSPTEAAANMLTSLREYAEKVAIGKENEAVRVRTALGAEAARVRAALGGATAPPASAGFVVELTIQRQLDKRLWLARDEARNEVTGTPWCKHASVFDSAASAAAWGNRAIREGGADAFKVRTAEESLGGER